MSEKVKAVMLPANKKEVTFPIIGKSIPSANPNSENGILELLTNQYTPFDNGWDWEYQYLYILSDEKIKEGDWVYSNHKNKDFPEEVFQLTGESWKTYKEFKNLCNNIKKVIAATDKSLNLIEPSLAFIEKYIYLYNMQKRCAIDGL